MQCISFHAGLKSFLPKATVEDLEKYDGELRVSLTSVHLDWWKTREIVVVGHTSIPARMSIRLRQFWGSTMAKLELLGF